MRRFTRTIIGVLILALLLAACSGCKKEEPANEMNMGDMDMTGEPAGNDIPDIGPEDAAQAAQDPQSTDDNAAQAAQSASSTDNASAPQSGAVAEVTAVKAYAFNGTLYAACEYKNAGDTPLVLTEAAFTLACGGSNYSESFKPIAAENDVIAPGETGYCTLWLPVEGVQAGAAVTAEAHVTAVATDQRRISLYVSEERLIQNYPGFATLSGKLKNAGSDLCELNVIYAGFYNENGDFLGAWHFTRAVTLKAGDSKAFVSHLRALPIPKLAEDTAAIKFAAFGL